MSSSPLTYTVFSDLIKKLLKSIDGYNSNDLTRSTFTTDENTSGEVAGICINTALHQMYDLIKDSKYLKAKPSENLISTADQEYIELDVEPYIDEIESITDITNDFKLIRRPWDWYRQNFPNPSNQSGTPLYYMRRDDRIYLAPTPSSSITYLCDFIKLQTDLVYDGDMPLIPSQYDYWIMAEAMVHWFKMEDPRNMPPIVVTDRNDAREIATTAIMSGYDMTYQAGSNFQRIQTQLRPNGPWDRLM